VSVPLNRPGALRLCRITFSGVIDPGGATAAGAEALYAEAPKSVKKNILRISYENKHDAWSHRHTEWKLSTLAG